MHCAWGKSGGVDPIVRSPGIGSSFGVTQIKHMIRILMTSIYKEDLDETERRHYHNYHQTYHVEEIPISDCAI